MELSVCKSLNDVLNATGQPLLITPRAMWQQFSVKSTELHEDEPSAPSGQKRLFAEVVRIRHGIDLICVSLLCWLLFTSGLDCIVSIKVRDSLLKWDCFEVKRVKAIKFYISDGFSNRQGFFIALIFLLKHLKWGQHINQPATTNKSAWMKAQAARVGGDLTADVKLSKRWRENYSIVGFTPGKKKKNSIWSAVKLG